MPIQHRNIIDEERHEVKGADTALAGTVPVADGLGSTSFQRIGVGQLSGSIPTAVPNLMLTTDGSGGFTANSNIYARLRTVMPTSSTYSTTLILNTLGFVVDGSAVMLTYPGHYFYSMENPTLDSIESAPFLQLSWPFVVTDANGLIANGLSGLVYLNAGVRYRINREGYWNLIKVTL